MENAQERLDSLNESIKRLNEAIQIAFEPIDSSIFVFQTKEISKAFKSLAESVNKNFSDLPTSTFVDALRHIDEMYRRDILPAISGIQFPESHEISPISKECQENLDDIVETLPDQFEEKSKLLALFEKTKEQMTLTDKLTLVLFLIQILWNLFTFTWEQTHPQQGDTTNININSVNIVEVNSQNEDAIPGDNRELAEKILDVISELTENIDDINGDIVSGDIVEPDRLDSVENDMDE